MSEIESSGNPNPNGSRYPDDARIQTDVALPSNRYRQYEFGGLFRVSVPDNWRQFADGASITFAPDGAFGNQAGESVFTHGAIVGVVDVSANNLQSASDQYISGVLQGNSYLRADGRYQKGRLGGRDALRRRLSGTSRVTNRTEIVDVYTTLLNNGRLFYIVQVAPDNVQRQYTRAFDNMVQSLRFLSPIIHFKCRACDAEIAVHPASVSEVRCPACKEPAVVQMDDTLLRENKVTTCISCGHDTLYIQKDFNRTVGIVIVTAGIMLSIYFFARGQVILAMGCLAGTAAVDFLLHLLVGEVTVCYSCHAIYRGFRKNPDHEPFDLKKLEKYGGRAPRFGK